MFYVKNDDERRTSALLEAAKLCGSQKNLGLKIKVKQSTINKWINNPHIKIPYEIALLIEKFTNISINDLVPHQKEVNTYIESRAYNTLNLLDIAKSAISTSNSLSLPFLQPNRFIITGTDGVLIAGLAILQRSVASTVPALVLDLISIIKKYQSIDGIINQLLISERIAIALRLEQIIGSRRGQINQDKKIIGRTATFAANISNFSKNTYIRGKQIYLSHSEQLINAIDYNQISISAALRLLIAAK